MNEKLRAINQSLTTRSKRNPTGMGASLGYVGAQMAGTPVDSPMSASMSELASGIKDETAIKTTAMMPVREERRQTLPSVRKTPWMIANMTRRE